MVKLRNKGYEYKMVNQTIQEKNNNQKVSQEGIDSKALLVCIIQYIPKLILFAVAGAVLGSGLNLIIVAMTDLRNPKYIAETEYYVDFADGRLEAKDHYNDFTWNDVMATDLILGKAMVDIGSEYDRNQIKDMITADILSDVRYLTITVKGTNKMLVANVSKALQKALENFGTDKDEFDSIYKIEDLGVQKEKIELFVWRAAFLGALIISLIALFLRIFRFSIGDSFYTKSDISRCFGLPVYGQLYNKDNKTDGIQEKMLISGLGKVTKNKELVYLLDVTGEYSEHFLTELKGIDNKKIFSNKLESFSETNNNKSKDIIIVVPFGRVCREQINDVIVFVEQQDYKVIGAVLADVDKKWARLYYGKV